MIESVTAVVEGFPATKPHVYASSANIKSSAIVTVPLLLNTLVLDENIRSFVKPTVPVLLYTQLSPV